MGGCVGGCGGMWGDWVSVWVGVVGMWQDSECEGIVWGGCLGGVSPLPPMCSAPSHSTWTAPPTCHQHLHRATALYRDQSPHTGATDPLQGSTATPTGPRAPPAGAKSPPPRGYSSPAGPRPPPTTDIPKGLQPPYMGQIPTLPPLQLTSSSSCDWGARGLVTQPPLHGSQQQRAAQPGTSCLALTLPLPNCQVQPGWVQHHMGPRSYRQLGLLPRAPYHSQGPPAVLH